MNRARRSVTSVLGRLAFSTRFHRIALRDRALIVLFHRVDDRYRGNAISCAADEFEAFCRFFKDHFDVVSLTSLLDALETGTSVDGKLVITFDDGYLDNATVAAPILKSLGLSACFFIVTDFIGSRHTAWWDRDAGIESEWMSWDQVRGLASDGFEIGAQTLTHIDLGVVRGEKARVELVESKTRLEAELGTPIVLFSYPYGRRDAMTEANRRLVREAGYRCCLSAYGGTVTAAADPFDLKRVAVSPWFRTPTQFGYEVLSERG